MFKHNNILWYPINVTKKDLKLAKVLVTLYGGPNGELQAAIRYLNQSHGMRDELGKKLLTDIGTEELGHVEMICVLFDQLTKGATAKEMKDAGLMDYYAEHGKEIFMQNASGIPYNTFNVGALGDVYANLSEDMAAEQKARANYEHIMDLTDDAEVLKVLSFLRQRELVHFACFKELYDHYKKMDNQ